MGTALELLSLQKKRSHEPHMRWQAWPAATESKAGMWREAEVCRVRMNSKKRGGEATWGLGYLSKGCSEPLSRGNRQVRSGLWVTQ